MWRTISTISLVSLVSVTGCPNPPVVDPDAGGFEEGGEEGGVGTAEDPSAQARDDFQRAVEHYELAKGTAQALPEASCEAVAREFSQVYDDHGDQMVIAEFNAGAAYQECGRLEQAKTVYQGLADRHGYHLAYNNLGVMLWDEGKTDQALQMFKKSVDADRIKAFSARNNLAAAHRDRYAETASQSDFEAAEAQLQNVLAVDTSNRSAYENLARLYYDRGRLKDRSYLVLSDLVITQALRVLGKAGEQSANIWNLKGLLFLERADNQVDALRAFKKAVAIEPGHVDANLNIAFIAIRFRDYQTAEKSLHTAMKHDRVSRDVEAHLALGVARRGQNDFNGARAAYEDALELDTGDPRPWFNLGILYQEHLISVEGTDRDQMEVLYGDAKKHFNRFISMAGKTPRFSGDVSDAKDRIIVIDDAIETFKNMDRIEEQAREIDRQEAEQAKEDRERLLELERKAQEQASDRGRF